MGDQYYRFFPGDYLRDTGDLTLLEHGAYMIMLHHYYTAESLPIEKDRLYRICRAFTKPEQQAIDIVVERYFRENGNGHLVNKRAEKELAERKAFKELQSEKGKRSAEKRWGKKDNQDVTTVTSRLQPEPNLPSPSPSPSLTKVKTHIGEKVTLPEWMTEETWSVFLSHRKTIKAPITKEAHPQFIRKFEKLKEEGYDPAFVVGTMVERGWRWFKP